MWQSNTTKCIIVDAVCIWINPFLSEYFLDLSVIAFTAAALWVCYYLHKIFKIIVFLPILLQNSSSNWTNNNDEEVFCSLFYLSSHQLRPSCLSLLKKSYSSPLFYRHHASLCGWCVEDDVQGSVLHRGQPFDFGLRWSRPSSSTYWLRPRHGLWQTTNACGKLETFFQQQLSSCYWSWKICSCAILFSFSDDRLSSTPLNVQSFGYWLNFIIDLSAVLLVKC